MAEPDQLERFRAAVAAWAAADADPAVPVRQANRLYNAKTKIADALAETADGRAALTEAARSDADTGVRISAAVTVQHWDTEVARQTFEEIVRAAGGTVERPMSLTAALAVAWGDGRVAALCLLNLDMPPKAAPPPPGVPVTPSAPVPRDQLDAAERVYGLAMNGGLEHAYELAGAEFPAAAAALDAVGAAESAAVLRELVELAGDTNQDQLDALAARFAEPDDIMNRLEAAAEVD